jgi:hypothetical protein
VDIETRHSQSRPYFKIMISRLDHINVTSEGYYLFADEELI